MIHLPPQTAVAGISAEEWAIRVDLAARSTAKTRATRSELQSASL